MLHRFYAVYSILDCVSDTAAAEMRAAYKVGFKDGATMMQEIQEKKDWQEIFG